MPTPPPAPPAHVSQDLAVNEETICLVRAYTKRVLDEANSRGEDVSTPEKAAAVLFRKVRQPPLGG